MKCAAYECPRGEGFKLWFGVEGPPLCQVHRMWWAADRPDKVTEDERAAWRKNNTHTGPDGEVYTTWPENFCTPKRATKEQLDKMQAMDTADRLKRQSERQKQDDAEVAKKPFRSRFGFNR